MKRYQVEFNVLINTIVRLHMMIYNLKENLH